MIPITTYTDRHADPTNGKVRHIVFPPRERVEEVCRQRANADNARWQAQVERRDALIQAAAADGWRRGEHHGYTAGWHWGLACGICVGGTAVAALWLVWSHLQGWLAAWGLA